jgi:hypothetical protein
MNKFYLLLIFLFFYDGLQSQTITIASNLNSSSEVVIGSANFFVSESIYTNAEFGTSTFTTPNAPIEKISFKVFNTGSPSVINNYKIWMKDTSSSVFSGTANFSKSGYINVFSGSINPTNTGDYFILLNTPFVRKSGKNLSVLIERLDSTNHTGFAFYTSNGNVSNSASKTSRRYSGSNYSTNLTATIYRPSMQFIHLFAIDAGIEEIINPVFSCMNNNQTVTVKLKNEGLNTIQSNTATIYLKLGGANGNRILSKQNIGNILSGESETIYFTGINLELSGQNYDTAMVQLIRDSSDQNNELKSSVTTANVLSNFPLNEDAESSLPVFPYSDIQVGDRQLWSVQIGNYTNLDYPNDTLYPYHTSSTEGIKFFLFDSWSGSNSTNYNSRLISNCIQMPASTLANPLPGSNISFWMSHDATFPTKLDSIYLIVSKDKGMSWSRIAGYSRFDVSATRLTWRQHVVDLSNYANEVIQLGFEGVSKYGNAIGIDDITILTFNPVFTIFTNFEVEKQSDGNQLNWTINKEISIDGFDIERSNDGIHFTQLKHVEAASLTFSFKDKTPNFDNNYYRIKLIQKNNTFVYSQVKSILSSTFSNIVVVNPVYNSVITLLNKSSTCEEADIMLTDYKGSILIKERKLLLGNKTNFISIPKNRMEKGIYLLSIKSKNQIATKKILIL